MYKRYCDKCGSLLMEGPNVIDPERFAKFMNEIREKHKGDEETIHILMDSIMCTVLKQFGYNEGVDIFNNTYKWYA